MRMHPCSCRDNFVGRRYRHGQHTDFVMNTMRRLVSFAFLLAVFACASTAGASAPPNFLKTDVPAMNRVLDSKILETFYKANAVAVAKRLGELGGVPVMIDIPARAQVALITRKYHLETLRDAFYIFSQDSGLQVDWYYVGRLPQAIRVSLAPGGGTEAKPESN